MAKVANIPVQPAVVNPQKIVRGMTTIFEGFSIMFEGMAEQLKQMESLNSQLSVSAPVQQQIPEAPVQTQQEEVIQQKPAAPIQEAPAVESVEEHPVDDADTPPWEEAPAEEPVKEAAPTITVDDISCVIVAKIKQKRSNNAKIGQLLKAYGVSVLSDLPANKYEKFLNDISEL